MTSLLIGHFVAPEGLNYSSNCFDWYAEMRDQAPISYDKRRRCWDIFRYKDAQKVLIDHSSFSSNRSKDKVDSIISMDPPEHMRFRSLATKEFSHRYVQRMSSLITEITEQRLKHIEKLTEIDFMQEIASPVPIFMLMRLMGIHERHYEDIKKWTRLTVSRSMSTGKPLKIALKNFKHSIDELNRFFEELMSEKQKNPQDDLVSDILNENKKNIELPKLRDFFRAILSAGSETTVNLLGNAMYLFLKNPQVLETLQANPLLIPNAIEEVLRFHSSVQCINRIAIDDITIGNHTIRSGQEVVIWLGSCNRDESIFKQANQFKIDRSPNPHLSFGQGIHYCMGSSLARLEAKIVLTKMLERFPKLSLSPSNSPVPNSNFVFRGYDHLNIRLV
ncbi:Cytochrome P450 [Seinonella peptonophila]|uniref:Cytochrome P450 n=1 Tax=Seinonella peptonophila TaxID=112248 RepID=A0A1M5AEY8_9BACL|nr:cytochrome P450 [Seinonella peptonophila]SHF28462.1 Cytochrome P450 [Seinonella peptonophila]